MYDDGNENGPLQKFMRGPGGTVISGVAITLFVAVVFGTIATFWHYVPRSRESHYRRERRMKHVQEDTTGSMKTRFLVGAMVGGIVGGAGFYALTKKARTRG